MNKIEMFVACIPKALTESLEKPAEIGATKGPGIFGSLTYTIKGNLGNVYALLCVLVTEVISKLHPEKEDQKEILDMLYGSVAEQLGHAVRR